MSKYESNLLCVALKLKYDCYDVDTATTTSITMIRCAAVIVQTCVLVVPTVVNFINVITAHDVIAINRNTVHI